MPELLRQIWKSWESLGVRPSESAFWAAPIASEVPPVQLLFIFFAAYVAGAAVGQALAIVPGVSITMWPPAGIFSATLLLSPPRSWRFWILAACLAELTANAMWFHNGALPALGYFAANTVEASISASLLRRFFGTPPRITTLKHVVALIIIGAGVAPMVGATLGCALDAATGKTPFAVGWPLWWLGDATGFLIAAPLVVAAADLWRKRATRTPTRLAEAAVVGVMLLVLGALGLVGFLPTPFVVTPVLLWASIRFGVYGAILGAIALALLVSFLTFAGLVEPTAAATPLTQTPAKLQIFLGVSAISALVVAALSQGREEALRDLRRSGENLEKLVQERTAEARGSEERLRLALKGARAGVWAIEFPARRATWSPELYDIFGLDPNSKPPSYRANVNMIVPQDRDSARAVFDRAVAEGGSFSVEFRMRRGDGEVVWVSVLGESELTASGAPGRAYGIAVDVTRRKQAEERATMLMHEVNHRAKNMLSVVQAIAQQTAGGSADEFIPRFRERIASLAMSQDLLVRDAWEAVSLELLVRTQLQHFSDLLDGRISIRGPLIRVTAQAAQILGMAIHELATNASKYGALSNDVGRIEISWRIADDSFVIDWSESGGPLATPPANHGFGSTVLTRIAKASLGAEVALNYQPTGLTWSLSCPVDKVRAGASTS